MDSRNIVVRNLTRDSSPDFSIKSFTPGKFDADENEFTDLRTEERKKDRAREIARISRLTGATKDEIEKAELAGINARNTGALIGQAVASSTRDIVGSLPAPISVPSDIELEERASEFLDEYLENRRRERDFD